MKIAACAMWLVACSSPAGPPANTARAKAPCPRLKVTADGAELGSLVVGGAILEQSTSNAGTTRRFYEIKLSPRAHGCGPEALVDAWQPDEPQLTIGYGDDGGFVTLAQVMADADVAAGNATPAVGGVLELCVRSTPARASGGSLVGKTVQVTGLVRATYCGTRAELVKKHGG
jgi:hypothetical protein